MQKAIEKFEEFFFSIDREVLEMPGSGNGKLDTGVLEHLVTICLVVRRDVEIGSCPQSE
jgi:hypothetical protein